MQRVLLVGDEPIPGYKLLEDLGGTAFYRHWKVRTPQGLQRLWKIVDLVVGNAAVETRTLGMLVQLRHPNLNTLSNFWEMDEGKTLVIESDMPYISLEELLEQELAAGKPGISSADLLDYMQQTAEALDFLNTPRHNFQGQKVAIYHRALRPQSLLLFQEGTRLTCKVSDFGLSKPVSEEVSQHSQGLANYDFDPPEFFEGQTFPTSDQYSLAINYYMLRTGKLPFGGSMLEQMQARLNDRPDLSDISDPEKVVMRRAMSRAPEKRYESCQAFVKALKTAAAESAASTTTTPIKPDAVPKPILKPSETPRPAAARPKLGDSSLPPSNKAPVAVQAKPIPQQPHAPQPQTLSASTPPSRRPQAVVDPPAKPQGSARPQSVSASDYAQILQQQSQSQPASQDATKGAEQSLRGLREQLKTVNGRDLVGDDEDAQIPLLYGVLILCGFIAILLAAGYWFLQNAM